MRWVFPLTKPINRRSRGTMSVGAKPCLTVTKLPVPNPQTQKRNKQVEEQRSTVAGKPRKRTEREEEIALADSDDGKHRVRVVRPGSNGSEQIGRRRSGGRRGVGGGGGGSAEAARVVPLKGAPFGKREGDALDANHGGQRARAATVIRSHLASRFSDRSMSGKSSKPSSATSSNSNASNKAKTAPLLHRVLTWLQVVVQSVVLACLAAFLVNWAYSTYRIGAIRRDLASDTSLRHVSVPSASVPLHVRCELAGGVRRASLFVIPGAGGSWLFNSMPIWPLPKLVPGLEVCAPRAPGPRLHRRLA